MLFNSLSFLIFFPIVVAIYFSISHKFRWILLLISSYYFYMSWKADYIFLIMFSTLIDYIAGIQIYDSVSKNRKKFFLYLSLVSNLGLLFAFKYFNFFSDSFRTFLSQFSIQLDPMTLKILLPVGISFYTFQTLSYTIDIYRGKMVPERHLGIFAVYISFFPQLVAGPIERARNFLPQFYKKNYFEYERVTNGLKLMLWGFFKKVVIADRLAIVVNAVFNNPHDYTGLSLIFATVFFAFQIYCDFSGYSDIAIGASQVMGFSLMDNFKRPYFSRSISEFWKRWHISLSTWFRDYLYIPLGGNRVSVPRMYVNIFIVFLVSGLWHGANWTFIFWGALHGIYIVLELFFKPFKLLVFKFLKFGKSSRISQFIEISFTFFLVNIGWIFFRANNMSDAFYILTHLFSNLSSKFSGITSEIGLTYLAISMILIGFMEFVHIIQEHRSIRQFLNNRPILFRWSIYFVLIFGILLLGIFGRAEFIYFQF